MVNLENSPEVLTFAILGNILNLAYNIPLVYRVWQTRSSKNISGAFLLLRFLGSISWLIYAALVEDVWVAASYTITLIATTLVFYIKCKDRANKKLITELELHVESEVIEESEV
tara:strand:+ start:1339 stop:1680 length:342 start_codon:yes stop_codon:yes gene_type:complete